MDCEATCVFWPLTTLMVLCVFDDGVGVVTGEFVGFGGGVGVACGLLGFKWINPEKTSTDGTRIITISIKAMAANSLGDFRGFGGGGGGGKSMLSLIFLMKSIFIIYYVLFGSNR